MFRFGCEQQKNNSNPEEKGRGDSLVSILKRNNETNQKWKKDEQCVIKFV